MTPTAVTAVLAPTAYLFGSIPFGFLAGRVRGIDVRKAGSGNIGATNLARLLGWRWGLTVFGLDMLKGLVPAWLAGRWLAAASPDGWGRAPALFVAWLAVGFCAILGHNFSMFLRFRGGKGVSTSLGVAVGVYPFLTYPALLALGVWSVTAGMFRVVGLASVAAGIAFPFLCWWQSTRYSGGVEQGWPFVAFACFATALILVRHRRNLARLTSRDGAPRG